MMWNGAIAFVSFMIYAAGGGRELPILAKDRTGNVINSVSGLTFIGVGIGLAFSDRR